MMRCRFHVPVVLYATPSERNGKLIVLRVLKLAQAPAVVAQSHGTELL